MDRKRRSNLKRLIEAMKKPEEMEYRQALQKIYDNAFNGPHYSWTEATALETQIIDAGIEFLERDIEKINAEWKKIMFWEKDGESPNPRYIAAKNQKDVQVMRYLKSIVRNGVFDANAIDTSSEQYLECKQKSAEFIHLETQICNYQYMARDVQAQIDSLKSLKHHQTITVQPQYYAKTVSAWQTQTSTSVEDDLDMLHETRSEAAEVVNERVRMAAEHFKALQTNSSTLYDSGSSNDVFADMIRKAISSFASDDNDNGNKFSARDLVLDDIQIADIDRLPLPRAIYGPMNGSSGSGSSSNTYETSASTKKNERESLFSPQTIPSDKPEKND